MGYLGVNIVWDIVRKWMGINLKIGEINNKVVKLQFVYNLKWSKMDEKS